jgi:heptosyltransferase-2
MNFMNKKSYRSILITRLSSLGDLVLISPIIRSLKEMFPESIIHLAASKDYASLYQDCPYLDGVFQYDFTISKKENRAALSEFMEQNGINKYEILLDLHDNLRTRALTNGLFTEKRKIDKNRLNKLSLVYRKKPVEGRNNHVVERYYDILKGLGDEFRLYPLEIWLPEEKGLEIYPPHEKDTTPTGSLKIALAPGSKHFTKRWPSAKFAEVGKFLVEKFGAEILILGGKEDVEVSSAIRAGIGSAAKNHSGSLSIVNALRKIDSCSFMICNDSGLMHLAAARNVPVIAIFGSTVRDFGFTPWMVRNSIIEERINCRPCSHIGRSKCPKGHFDCMNKISSDRVIEEVKKFLE